MQEIEKTILRISKDQDTELENMRKQLMTTIQGKADFRDLDSLSQKLHAKSDT